MFKRFILLILEFGAGLASNLVAAAIQQDAWQNLFTPTRLLATGVGSALMLLVVALLESEHSLAWSWPWHRFWYLHSLAKDPQLRQWEKDFARLKLLSGRHLISATELLSDIGERRDMVALLCDMIVVSKRKGQRILILGEPGSGKTTGMERLTWELAKQGMYRLGWDQQIPVLIRLGNYQDGKLINFASDEVKHAVDGRSGEVLSKGLSELLKKGRVVLLCDALDEALGERRDLVLAEIDRLLSSRVYQNVSIVITARTREDPANRLNGLHPYTIQELSDEAVNLFVHAYCRELNDESKIITYLKETGMLVVGGLGRNPFWLQLVIKSGTFQAQKGEILKQSIQLLLEREWDKPETQRTGWSRVSPKDAQLRETNQALAWLAYQMSDLGVVSLPYDQVVHDIVSTWLTERSAAAQLKATNVVGLGRDAQLLAYWPGPLRFRHRLVQEAMTAQLLANDIILQRKAVAKYATDDAWWETLLMLGQLTPSPENMINAILSDDHSESSLLLATVILQGMKKQEPTLQERVVAALAQNLVTGVNERHKAAVVALSVVARGELAAMLSNMTTGNNASLQKAAFELVSSLNVETLAMMSIQSLLQIIQKGDATLQWVALEALTRKEEDTKQLIWDSGTIFADRQVIIESALMLIANPRPGLGIVARDGIWLPDIVFGGRVPSGTYFVGLDKSENENNKDSSYYYAFDRRQVTIAQAYQMARYPITFCQFECFLIARDFENPAWWTGIPDSEKMVSEQTYKHWDHPREKVSWYQAIAFCRWLSDKLGHDIDLPHENEWEVAARYPEGHKYPWGDNFVSAWANTVESGLGRTSAVDLYSIGFNPAVDLYDMSGNVQEWCRNKYREQVPLWGIWPFKRQKPMLYRDIANDAAIDESDAWRALRGGSYRSQWSMAGTTFRSSSSPYSRSNDIGFRVILRNPRS